ncbi:MAG: DMT family transporter [Desertifilum sp. SIO1I2]|nr:DMT family transporter [Desertifilum sp. SIO1I2]
MDADSSSKPQIWQVVVILTIGVFAVSTAAIFIRLSMAAAGVQGVGFSLVVAALRLTLASLILLPAWRGVRRLQPSRRAWLYAIAAGGSLAVHFAMWISSLSYTSIAASTTLVTTNPVWVALISWWWWQETPTKQTILGIAIALLGSILIALGTVEAAESYTNPLLGDGLALVGAWAASCYFLLGREAQRQGMGVGSYVAVAYSAAALVLLPLPLIWGTSYAGYPLMVYVYIFLMALVSQAIGHTSCNWAVRWISPTLVTLAILLEPVSASLLGYLIFKELPSVGVGIGAIAILTGVAIAVLGTRPRAA